MTTDHHFPFDLTGEVWREIVDHPGYFISNLGRGACARTLGPKTRIDLAAARLLKLKPRENGYLYLSTRKITLLVQRLVAAAFMEEAPSPDHVITFDDGDTQNCNVSNLTWKTRGEKRQEGLYKPIPARLTRCTLSDADVRRARKDHEAGVPRAQIARKFGVTPSAIWHIDVGRTWSHVV